MENKINYDIVFSEIKKYIIEKEELKVIDKAYQYALEKHCGQIRMDGSEYIDHPLNIVLILTTLKADYQTLAASFLHETINLGNVTIEELKDVFPGEIIKLVAGITKINKIPINIKGNYTTMYYKRILVGLCEDVRVIYIKLADRLHNMRTLWALPADKQKEKAKETLDIIAPIAHHLGIYQIKHELEDLSLKYLNKTAYDEVVQWLNNSKVERDQAVFDMKESLGQILKENNIEYEIKGRSKSIYSIYNKITKGKKFEDIYDILGLRIYVNTVSECYLALGLIHSKYKPVPKRFKDYIANPKENMYQSLHTTVFGVGDNLFEIQIRTYEMDRIAEYGIASHASYKEKGANYKDFIEQKLQVFRSIIELNQDTDDLKEFEKNIQCEIIDKNIYVYTPKGDVIELPKGSTPIDFAYRVHSGVAERMIGAIVNDNIVTLNYKLNDGDIIKINTTSIPHGPKKEWLKIVVTAQAKNKIKNYFSKIDKSQNIKKGEDILLKELRKMKKTFSEFFSEENINLVLDNLKLDNIEELYNWLGIGKINVSTVLNLVQKEVKTPEKFLADKLSASMIKDYVSKNDVIVAGIDEIKVNLAQCCMPIPGDKIIGYITKGNGISVHRSDCPNIKDIDERILEVQWNPDLNKKFPANLIVQTDLKENIMLEILAKTNNLNISVQSINTINQLEYYAYDLIVLVENKEKLNKLISGLNQLDKINSVERVIK